MIRITTVNTFDEAAARAMLEAHARRRARAAANHLLTGITTNDPRLFARAG